MSSSNPYAPPLAGKAYDPYGRDQAQERYPEDIPPPPNLHWALVLLFTVLTATLFYDVWALVQAAWVRKIDPTARAMKLQIAFVACNLAHTVVSEMEWVPHIVSLLLLVALIVFFVWAAFSMRASMEHYFTHELGIDVPLSGLMTFFFPVFYFQYHMSRIARWKKTGDWV